MAPQTKQTNEQRTEEEAKKPVATLEEQLMHIIPN